LYLPSTKQTRGPCGFSYWRVLVRNEGIHVLEHFSFFFTAFLFWQVFADLTENVRMRRTARFGLGIFMIFGAMLVSGLLGVLITFSTYIWYPVYIHETALYGLTALEDQHSPA
jgi:putative membrane protein